MRSLRNAKDAKIFKFHDFTEAHPEKVQKDELISPSIPYLLFEGKEERNKPGEQEAAENPYFNFGEEGAMKKAEASFMSFISEVPYLNFGEEDFLFRRGDPLPGTKEMAPELEEEEPEAEMEEQLELPPVKTFAEPSKTTAEKIIDEAEQKANEIIEEAHKKAQEMIGEAKDEAINILAKAEEKTEKLFAETKEEAYKAGHEKGMTYGTKAGQTKAAEEAKEKYSALFTAIDKACAAIDEQKEEILQQGIKDLTDLSLTISQKVISVSLDTCGEVVKRMILSAAADAHEKQWAKITISAKDAQLMEEEGINIGNELYAVSDKIDLIVVDDAESGTCLVEFPDQAIDASAQTQFQNIKAALYDADQN